MLSATSSSEPRERSLEVQDLLERNTKQSKRVGRMTPAAGTIEEPEVVLESTVAIAGNHSLAGPKLPAPLTYKQSLGVFIQSNKEENQPNDEDIVFEEDNTEFKDDPTCPRIIANQSLQTTAIDELNVDLSFDC
nr:uncharacterized protein LOC109178742 [Ipomoea trifida]